MSSWNFWPKSGQKIWQVLPLGPTGYGDSPYQCFSAFAGNPLLIDLKALQEQGLLSLHDFVNAPDLPEDHVEYGRVIDFKYGLLRKAAQNFLSDGEPGRPRRFRRLLQEQRPLAGRLCAFHGVQGRLQGSGLGALGRCNATAGTPSRSKEWQEKLASEIEIHKFAQFEFFRQWEKLRDSLPSLRNQHHGRYSNLRRSR